MRNIGENGSELDWEIRKYPDWGEWTFTPSEGQNLTPSDGFQVINVTIRAPDEQKQSYSGEIVIGNKWYIGENITIPVSLTTPKSNSVIINSLLQRFIDNHPRMFPILRMLLRF